MPTQAERRRATRAALVKAARILFGRRGFRATTIDQIAESAGVAKGAVYHHFPTKVNLFEAVLESVSEQIADEVRRSARDESDILVAMATAIRTYFAICAKKANARIVLKDGPAVLGWERWREIDARHFGGGVPVVLEAAMQAGTIKRQPVEPLSRLLLGAITEAAVGCATHRDYRTASSEYVAAIESLLEGIRAK